MSTVAEISKAFLIEEDNGVAMNQVYFSRRENMRELCVHYNIPISRNDRVDFCQLAIRWEEETRFSSSIDEICMHPAYQRIIGMGEKVLPLIFQELEKEPSHWFWALSAITGQDPIQQQQKGDLREMTKAWLAWAKDHGY